MRGALFAIALSLAALACGGGSSSASSGSPGASVTGTWSTTWLSQAGGSGQGTMQLTSSGGTFQGSVLFASSPCFGAAQVSGTVRGEQVQGSVDSGPASATFEATLSSSAMSGTYAVTGPGACSGDHGTFSASR